MTEDLFSNHIYRGECSGIFTPYYLGKPLREYLNNLNQWLSDDKLRPVFFEFQKLWQAYNRLGLQHANEKRTRREFIDKALELLGFCFLDEETLPQKGEGTPDYLLFNSEDDKNKAAEDDSTKFKLAIGIAEAKKWGLDLGSREKEKGNRFPHHQVADYLKAASYSDKKTYFDWSVLTNATHWRLYTRQAKPFSYYEINLEQAIFSIDNFRYFYILFNAAAFRRDIDNKCLLDYLYSESLEKQEALEKDLRKRIFVLVKVLANGFYNYPTNEITSKDLDALYENCLIFLYRLLFVFYAEGLNLLPAASGYGIDSKYYRERYSLRRFRKLWDDKIWTVEEDQLEARLYDQVDELFDLINGHNEKKNELCRVTRYNGGLFDPDNYPLLKKWKVGDYSLSEVLKGLIYIPLPSEAGATTAIQTGETIDYSSLEIRQLGSIYEGLLEQQLKLNKVNNELEWVEDKSERKSSGSYYTPDYIVKYIVNHTLQPLVDRIAQQDNVKSGIENSFAKAVFELHVLDPAMGSAHFLVRATEFLAEQIMYHPTTVQAVTKVPFGLREEDAEKAYWLRRVVESCIYGVDLNPLAVELAKLSLWLTCISSDKPLNFLDHHLRCGNSLVGAKTEELGNLAKKGKTITVFERIQGLDDKLAQAQQAIHKITAKETNDIEAVETKKHIWDKDVQKELAPFRAIADLRTSMDFGLDLKAEDYQEIVTELLKSEADEKGEVHLSAELVERYRELWAKHEEIVKQYRPFHWELEFPDVFVTPLEGGLSVRSKEKTPHPLPSTDLEGGIHPAPPPLPSTDLEGGFQPALPPLRSREELKGGLLSHGQDESRHPCDWGFDAVIGNPPYVSFGLRGVNRIGGDDNTYYRYVYSNSAEYKLSLYAIFMEKGISLLKNELGLQSFIVPDSFLVGRYFSKIRSNILSRTVIRSILWLPYKVFEATVGYSVVYIVQKPSDEKYVKVRCAHNQDEVENENFVEFSYSQNYFKSIKYNRFRLFFNEKTKLLIAKIEEDTNELRIYMTGHTGVRSLIGQSKIVSKNKLSDTWEKGLVSGGQIKRYNINDENDYININASLLNGGGWNYEIVHNPKILIRQTGDSIIATLDENHYYHLNNIHSFSPKSKENSLFYYLALLNSKMMGFYYQTITLEAGRPLAQTDIETLESLPVKNADHARHDRMVSLVQRMLDLNKRLHEATMDNEKDELKVQIDSTDKEIDQLVYELYGLTEEEIKIVEEG